MTPERIEEHKAEAAQFLHSEVAEIRCIAEERVAICNLALDGLRLRQGKVLHNSPAHHLTPGQQIVLVDKEAKP